MSSEPFVFEFDLSIYRLASVKKAAYKYAGRYDIQIRTIDDGRVCVTLHRQNRAETESPHANDFPNEVLDQELRECVSQETEGVRNLLLAQAFSSLSLVDPVGDTAEFDDDALDIGRDSSASGTSSWSAKDRTSPEQQRSH